MRPAENAAFTAEPLRPVDNPPPPLPSSPLEYADATGAVDGLGGDALRRAMALVIVAWMFGSVWMTATSGSPITLFAHHLRASKFEFGLLAALPFIASLVSMPASLVTERTGRRKAIFLWALYIQRALWFAIAVVPVWIVSRYGFRVAQAAMVTFLVLLFVVHALNAIGGPAWVSWMADIVPDRVRGKYFSRRRQWGIVSAVPAALVVGLLLDRLAAPGAAAGPLTVLRWCAIIFMCAAVFGLADIALFQAVPEIRMKPQREVSFGELLRKPLRNREFLWFAGFIATLTFAVSFMGQFVTLYLLERVGVSNTGVQLMLLVAPMLAQFLVLPVWGHAVDRMGKKPVLILSGLGLVPVGLGWCLMTSGSVWLGYALSAAGAALWTGVEIANFNLVLEFSSTTDSAADDGGGSSYVAVNTAIINIAGCAGGLASGIIAQTLKDWSWQTTWMPWVKEFTFYELLFALSGVLRLAAVVVFLPHIHEHDARPTREALRFMTANIYNNLFNAVLQPVRFLRVKLRDSYVENEE
jgi:MFS family permease